MKKRDLFAELMSGVDDMAAQREGKITLRQFTAKAKAAPVIAAVDIINLRNMMNVSQAVFARTIRTNPATLRNWEQNRSQPNPQAALLIRLVEKYPDVLGKLERL